MTSVGSILQGTPATLRPALLPPSSGGLYVDSLNTLKGDLAIASGAGIAVAAAGTNITVSNTGVTSAVAGTGITVSGATGAVTISRNPAVGFTSYLNAQENFEGGALPTFVAPETITGGAFTPAVTALYAVEFGWTSATNPMVFGAGDSLVIGLYPGVAGNPEFYTDFYGPSDPAASQSNFSQTVLVQLDAGTVYTPKWYAVNTSTTLDLGAGALNPANFRCRIYAP
jgi:hypothetical protein